MSGFPREGKLGGMCLEVSLGITEVRTVAERKEVRCTPMIRLLPQKNSSGTTFGCFKGKESRRFFHLSRIVRLGTSRLVGKCRDCVTRVWRQGLSLTWSLTGLELANVARVAG